MNNLVERAAPSPLQLPVLHVEVTGKVTASNLDAYRVAALELFNGINTTLSTDEDFAGADRAVKWCGDVEDKLVLAKRRTLEQTADINAILTTLDEIGEQARQKRLQLEKLIKSRKESVKQEIIDAARKALSNHMDAMNAALKMGFTLPAIPVNFVDAIKNKRTFSGIQEAVNAELTRATSQATTIANTMRSNIKSFDELSEDANYAHLFRDMASLLTKEPESFVAVVKQRIADELARLERVKEQAAEEERQRQAKETERLAEQKRQEDEAAANKLAQEVVQQQSEPIVSSDNAADLLAKIEARAAEIKAERAQQQEVVIESLPPAARVSSYEVNEPEKLKRRLALESVMFVLSEAPRMGADTDYPEGTRYIQISETMVRRMYAILEHYIETGEVAR